jgi:enediyne biosynthesis protein E4
MGIALADHNHSGRFSIAVTPFNEEYPAHFRNDGDMKFTDVSYSSGIGPSTLLMLGGATDSSASMPTAGLISSW